MMITFGRCLQNSLSIVNFVSVKGLFVTIFRSEITEVLPLPEKNANENRQPISFNNIVLLESNLYLLKLTLLLNSII